MKLHASIVTKSALTLLSVFVLWCIATPYANAASFTVNTTNDTIDNDIGDGVCADEEGNCSLRAAVQETETVPGDDTITLPANTYTLSIANSSGDEDFAHEGDLDITDTNGTITLNGAGKSSTIIDANGIDRVLEVVPEASLVLNNLTVTGGALGAASGAGIENFGTLELSHVSVSYNTITGDPAHITLYYGIGIHCASGSVSISDSTISYNRFGDGINGINGGGLYTNADCNTVAVTRTNFSHNEGYEGGGAHVNASTTTSITFTDMTSTYNTSGRAGAGLYSNGADGDNPVEVHRSTFTNNETDTSGGGIFSGGPLNVTNTTFYNNTANMESGVGGGIYVNTVDDSVISIAFSTFTNNSAVSAGGIYYDGVNDSVRVRGVVVAQNNGTNPDCYGNLVSNDYNYIADITDCTITEQDHDQLSVSPPSYMRTLTPSNHGGLVDTLAFTGSEVKDRVPSAACLDAGGDALVEDARGAPRPEPTACDIGAYELDQTNPDFSITGNAATTVECAATYVDAGAEVSDNFAVDGDVQTESTVDTNIVGEYAVTYTASDYDGNSASAERIVTVSDTTIPTITLTGESTIQVPKGGSYTDAGATATDGCAGDISSSIIVDNPVDTTEAGEYVVTYTATDPSGNIATETRTVKVKPVRSFVQYHNKKIVVTLNDVVQDQQKVTGVNLKPKFRLLNVRKLYPQKNYTTVAFLASYKKRAVLTVFRLTPEYKLVKKQRYEFDTLQRRHLAMEWKPKEKRIVVKVGKGKKTILVRTELNSEGKLSILE